jgi:hypothetical protein
LEKAILPADVTPDAAFRSGPVPTITKLNCRVDECNYAAALIETLLLAGFDININGERVKIEPEDITILYPRKLTKWEADPRLKHLCERLGGLAGCVRLNGYGAGTIGVKASTIHSAKGLQFRFVILIWAD